MGKSLYFLWGVRIWHAGKSTRLAFPGSPKKLRVEPSNFTSPQWKPREAERCFLLFFSPCKRSGIGVLASSPQMMATNDYPGVISLLAAVACIILLRVGLGKRETGIVVCV